MIGVEGGILDSDYFSVVLVHLLFIINLRTCDRLGYLNFHFA